MSFWCPPPHSEFIRCAEEAVTEYGGSFRACHNFMTTATILKASIGTLAAPGDELLNRRCALLIDMSSGSTTLQSFSVS